MSMSRTIRFALLICFLTSMPLTLVNGHGVGWLADGDHWQGYEITLFWGGLLLPFSPFGFGTILLASTMMFVTPFLNLRTLTRKSRLIVMVWSALGMLCVPLIVAGWYADGIYPAFCIWAGPILALGSMNFVQCNWVQLA